MCLSIYNKKLYWKNLCRTSPLIVCCYLSSNRFLKVIQLWQFLLRVPYYTSTLKFQRVAYCYGATESKEEEVHRTQIYDEPQYSLVQAFISVFFF